MALTTPFTRLLGVAVPVALAPMGGSAGGRLAAEVTNGGGLGLVGAGTGDPEWMERELAIARDEANGPWGVGLLGWATSPDHVDRAARFGPAAVMISFGDPGPFVDPVRRAGARLIVQVVDADELDRAIEVGADVIVAQGSESGGHGARHGVALTPFLAQALERAGEAPVLAAGGVNRGVDLAAVLRQGAAGALVGTRFQATPETLADPAVVAAIVDCRGDGEAITRRSYVHDVLRRSSWPKRYDGRTLTDRFVSSWCDREDDLEADEAEIEAFRAAVAAGELPGPVWVNQSVDTIREVRPAAEVVAELAADAERAMAEDQPGGR